MKREPSDVPPSRSGATPKVLPLQKIRLKQARRSVLFMDRLADRTITIGGVFVILAVFGILIFLVSQVIPLFRGGEVTSEISFTVSDLPAGPRPAARITNINHGRILPLEFRWIVKISRKCSACPGYPGRRLFT